MRDTMFLPPPSLRPRIAPTQKCTPYGWPCEGAEMHMLRGVVHDPTARRMGGVAGHAGLFSTASDLAVFAQMLLNGGSYNGTRIVADSTVKLFTRRAAGTRALGWDTCGGHGSCGTYLCSGAVGSTEAIRSRASLGTITALARWPVWIASWANMPGLSLLCGSGTSIWTATVRVRGSSTGAIALTVPVKASLAKLSMLSRAAWPIWS